MIDHVAARPIADMTTIHALTGAGAEPSLADHTIVRTIRRASIHTSSVSGMAAQIANAITDTQATNAGHVTMEDVTAMIASVTRSIAIMRAALDRTEAALARIENYGKCGG